MKRKRRILDCYCCAGGAAKGYSLAGFDVVGIDKDPQPHYPYAFVRMDVIEALTVLLAGRGITDNSGRVWYLSDFDVIHASPPCQKFTSIAFIWRTRSGYNYDARHPDLVATTRQLLIQARKPYVIENVVGAPLENPILLCGLMFSLQTIRHRIFETNPFMLGPAHIKHPAGIKTNSFRGYSSFENGATHITVAGHNFRLKDASQAMGIAWMNREEIAEAVPPAYTEFIGQQMIQYLFQEA